MRFKILRKDAVKVNQDINYKLNFRTATLDDQDEALKKPNTAYRFARYVSGADIQRCQEVVCRDPTLAYMFARDIPGSDINMCQEAACKNPHIAHCFALNISRLMFEQNI